MSETLKRITPAEVVEAYRKTGLGITRNTYVTDDKHCACGLGVYAIGVLGAAPDFCEIDHAIDAGGFVLGYQNGFSSGFDGSRRECRYPEGCEEWRAFDLGYDDGAAAYAAAKEAVHVD